jgi:hypothetical protein
MVRLTLWGYEFEVAWQCEYFAVRQQRLRFLNSIVVLLLLAYKFYEKFF